jgi:hypothetical protein
VTAKEIIASLPLVDENILAEAARQPGLFAEAAMLRVEKMRKRAEAVSAIEYFRSKLALHFRSSKTAYGDKKLTEGAIKERIEANKAHRELRATMESAYEEEEFSKLLLECLRQRRDAIRVIADARLQEVAPNEIDKAVRRKLVGDARKLEEKRRRELDED